MTFIAAAAMKAAVRFIFLSLCFLSLTEMQAQDVIELKNGQKIESKVVEVLKKEIVYRKFSNPSGPSYRIDISEVSTITYESGAIDNFSKKRQAKDETEVNSFFFGKIPRVNAEDLGNNIISMDVVDLIVQNITFSYERLLGEQRRFGMRIPMSFCLLGTSPAINTIYNQHNLYYSGIDFSFYPFGQGQSRFLLGPSIRVGNLRERNEKFLYYDTLSNISFYENTVTLHPYFSFLMHGGFSWHPVKDLSIQTLVGVGTRRYFTKGPDNYELTPTGFFTFSVGYRF